MFRKLFIATVLIFFLAVGATAAEKRKLLVYCGITMVTPMTEIAQKIEASENCEVLIIRSGSGDLLKKLLRHRDGDLFLPGSESYIKQLKEKEGDLVTETRHVGHNWAAMMVPKGNPRNIAADLDSLADNRYVVVLGDPKTGSIGRETKKVLEKKGIYEKVLANGNRQTRDSKGLMNALRFQQADMVVNWHAVSTWPENEDFVDVLPIEEKYAERKKLVLAHLKTSRHPDLARKFMDLAASAEGREIFRKHGLYYSGT